MAVGRREAFSIQALQLTDAGLVWLAFWLGDVLRAPIRSLLDLPPTTAASLEQMTWMLFVVVPFVPLTLEFFRYYIRLRHKSSVKSVTQLLRTFLLVGLVVGLVVLFLRPLEGDRFGASRAILGLGSGFSLIFLFLRDRATTHFLQNRRVREELKERVVFAGTPEEIDEFIATTHEDILEGLKVVGRFDLAESDVKELYGLLKDESVERVIFAAGGVNFDKVASAVEACELQGVEAWIGAAFIRTQVARPTFDLMGDRAMLVLRSTPELSWELFLKALFDRVVAAILIIATFPLWVFAWVGIRFSSPGGPALFGQKRAGRYGKPFQMWKFRTMVPNAEELLVKIKEEHGNQMDGPVFKLENDPRVFRFGAFLRKFSIDELPQLINVLMGQMSLVGPRPLPLYEVQAFEKTAHRRRLSVKPGITCEWQAGGRNRITSFEQWVEMDLRYIDNWSFWLDVKILLKTVPAVLLGWGAK